MNLKIDLKIFLVAILFYFTNQLDIYFTIMFFTIIHECGHLLAGIVLGRKIKELKITPFGVSVLFKINLEEYNQKVKKANIVELKKIIIAIAGPLTNILTIIIACIINLEINTKNLIIYSNLIIIAFNLIPIYPLDGGRILKGIMYIAKGKIKAEKSINQISIIFAILLTAVSSISILYLQNIAVFLIIVYLWFMVINENKKYRFKEAVYKTIQQKL